MKYGRSRIEKDSVLHNSAKRGERSTPFLMSLSNVEIFGGYWHQGDFMGLTVGRVSDDISHAISNLEEVESSVMHHPIIRPAQVSLDKALSLISLFPRLRVNFTHQDSILQLFVSRPFPVLGKRPSGSLPHQTDSVFKSSNSRLLVLHGCLSCLRRTWSQRAFKFLTLPIPVWKSRTHLKLEQNLRFYSW